jgi:hypothetical protein
MYTSLQRHDTNIIARHYSSILISYDKVFVIFQSGFYLRSPSFLITPADAQIQFAYNFLSLLIMGVARNSSSCLHDKYRTCKLIACIHNINSPSLSQFTEFRFHVKNIFLLSNSRWKQITDILNYALLIVAFVDDLFVYK